MILRIFDVMLPILMYICNVLVAIRLTAKDRKIWRSIFVIVSTIPPLLLISIDPLALRYDGHEILLIMLLGQTMFGLVGPEETQRFSLFGKTNDITVPYTETKASNEDSSRNLLAVCQMAVRIGLPVAIVVCVVVAFISAKNPNRFAALITSAGFVFLLIIVVLLRHQQRMAAILNRQAVDVQPNSDDTADGCPQQGDK